jgi:hypothetical protein
MSFTLIESDPAIKRGPIMIKPYFNNKVQNMGLEKYGLALYDGVFQEEQLACIEMNGIRRYVTGLNEFAPEVKLIKDPDERNAKVKEIRTVVAQLERELAANVINVEDTEFWNKVKLLRPDNDEFWSKITLRCGNEPLHLEPSRDPYDLIKLYAIEAGGFSIVCRSYEEARMRPKPPKFYLDKFEETVSTKTESKKLRNKALSELDKLFNKNTNKLFYIAKVVDTASVQYKKTTPNDVLYENMDNFINGEGSEKNQNRAAQMFLDTADKDMETLKIRAMVKDATYYKFIVTKADGFIYDSQSSSLMGRTPADVVEYLKNPLNEEILVNLMKKVEKYWNQ